MTTKMICSDLGVDNKEDAQHLDHEIKELNESNMKIEADMMQLQTQVDIHSEPLWGESAARARFPLTRRLTFCVSCTPKADIVDGM